MTAYSDPSTGKLLAEFDQAIAMFVWAWFIISMIFTVATVRSSWTLFGALIFVDLTLILLAVGYMLDQEACLKAASATGFVTAALACKSFPNSISTGSPISLLVIAAERNKSC